MSDTNTPLAAMREPLEFPPVLRELIQREIESWHAAAECWAVRAKHPRNKRNRSDYQRSAEERTERARILGQALAKHETDNHTLLLLVDEQAGALERWREHTGYVILDGDKFVGSCEGKPLSDTLVRAQEAAREFGGEVFALYKVSGEPVNTTPGRA